MRIVIDLDGTICELKQTDQTYADVRPLPGAIERLQSLHAEGHTIIIQTARHMASCAGDQGKVLKRVGKTTLDWLDRFEIPYDEIYFGKPNADVYIDDRAMRFSSWSSVDDAALQEQAR